MLRRLTERLPGRDARRLLSRLLLPAALAAAVAACGGDGDDGGATAATTTPGTQTVPTATAPGDQGWKRVVPGGDCRCSDGSEFSFWLRKANPRKVVF